MKSYILGIFLFVTSTVSSHAQIFRPLQSNSPYTSNWTPVVGAAGGAGIGAIIGHQSKHTKEGALIGAGVGLIGGFFVQDQAIQNQNNRMLMPVQPRQHTGKIVGTILGGTAGAIIGHQSGKRNEGALIGAGVGLLGGFMYDRSVNNRYQSNIARTNQISSNPYSINDARSNAELSRIYGSQANALFR